ncbi:hypothetical protein ACFE04_013691 [Oxalis oulophora]
MEDRVHNTVHIIDDDGDTFAKRAEMYYKKRPELLNLVEESYRSYRALAERYDHLSRDLQSANRTIASVFPERAHEISMDEEDEQNSSGQFKGLQPASSKGGKIPKVPTMVPNFRSTSMVTTRKKQLKRIVSTVKAKTSFQNSGLTKGEALEEIDRLQRGILVLQTETELVKSTYDNANAKYWEIQTQITEMQQKVCNLEDEFGIGTLIDDNEARTLMATTALKSCQETLGKLEEQFEKSAEEVNIDHGRIKEARSKVAILRKKFMPDQHDSNQEKEVTSSDMELEDNLERFLGKIKKDLEFNSNTPLTVLEMAEKIDEIVDKVVHLETSVSSQTAVVKKLRSETDELMSRIRALEEKEVVTENTESMKNRIKQLEEELKKAKGLNKKARDENKNIKSQLTEASCNIDNFIEKLQKVKMQEEFEGVGLSPDEQKVKSDNPTKEHEDKLASGDNSNVLENMKPDINEDSMNADINDVSTQEKNNDKPDEEMEEGDKPDWKQLFEDGLEDREKILMDEYSSVLQNYKDVKVKLGDVEKKNRDGFYELALQIKELKNTVNQKDEEIQVLRKMASPADGTFTNPEAGHESINLAPDGTFTNQEVGHESINLAPSSENSALSSPKVSKSPSGEMKNIKSPEMTTIEEKIRSHIDEILEENLEFWLRFSSSFYQIKKFETSVVDLRSELYELKNKIKQEGSTGNSGKQQTMYSEAKPIYKHLRDIQTELSLWLQNNSVLKDEIIGRYSSLCSIQEEISSGSHVSEYQAATFQGEITNMKQENKKVAQELQAGSKRVEGLKAEIEKILILLDEELGISEISAPSRSFSRPRIPLRSFLFGVKLKRQKNQKHQARASLLSCMAPALNRQDSILAEADWHPS